MAINPIQLALDQLAPVLSLDSGIEAAIPRQIAAQTALQGWQSTGLTDQQSVYISILSVQALIPRLLLLFAQELKKAKGGPAEAEFQDAIEFLKALQKQLSEQANRAAREAAPEDAVLERFPGYPRPEVKGFE